MSVVIDQWTGRTAALLQAALRLTNEQYAERLGVAVRTVSRWHALPDGVPRKDMQEVLETAYERAPEKARARFELNFPPPPAAPQPAAVTPMAVEVAVLQTRMEQLQAQLDQLATVQREMTLLRVRMEHLAKQSEMTGAQT